MRRREFIKKSALGTAGATILTAAGSISSCTGNDPDRKLTFALIGSGSRGPEVAKGISNEKNVTLKYICDVNDSRAENGISRLSDLLGYTPEKAAGMQQIFDDSEVDAVIIATPVHWNAPAAIRACQAGKDVYVEAFPSHCIEEGKKLMQAARKYKRIVQTGYQNRSSRSLTSARAFVESGQLGPVVQMKAYNLTSGSVRTNPSDSAAPDGINWDLWLGPASTRPFNEGIYNGDWTRYWDFSNGSLSVKAGHALDMARAIAGNPGHPRSVYCLGGNRIWNSQDEVPELMEITWDYGKFVLTCVSGNGTNYMKNVTPEGASFPDWMRIPDRLEVYGTKGLMYIGQNGEGWQVIGPGDKVLAEGKDINPGNAHFANFVNNVRTRTEPAANAEQGHLSTALVHLGNISYRTGNRRLIFDGTKERFINAPEADKLLTKSYRKQYYPGRS